MEIEVCRDLERTIGDMYSLPSGKNIPLVLKQTCQYIIEENIYVSGINTQYRDLGAPDKGMRGVLRKSGAKFGPYSEAEDLQLRRRFNMLVDKVKIRDKAGLCRLLKTNIGEAVHILGLFVGQDFPTRIAALNCKRIIKLEVGRSFNPVSPPMEKPVVLLSFVDPPVCKELAAIVTQLGGVLTENPKACSHLVMGKLARTTKLLISLPVVKHVLLTNWIRDSREAGRWISEKGYFLEDQEVEKRFKFNLSRTMAKSNRNKLFMGKTFYLTPSIQPSKQDMKDIITSSGGRYNNLSPTCQAVSFKFFQGEK